MKIIRESAVNSIHNVLDIEKFLFVLKEMKGDELTNQFIESISSRISNIKKSCDDIVVACNNMLSSNSAKGIKQFDIMKGDGSIEIGLEATDAETLKNMYRMTGDDIQILREINEYGVITKTNEPTHCEQKIWDNYCCIPTNNLQHIENSNDADSSELSIFQSSDNLTVAPLSDDTPDPVLDDLIESWKKSLNKTDTKTTKKTAKKSTKRSKKTKK